MSINRISLFSTAAILASALSVSATQALAGAESFSDDTNAKMARVKAKTQRMKTTGDARSTAKDRSAGKNATTGDCGSINIGNTVNQGTVGVRKQETIVIIDGDVINANNNCKK
jgi:hypothetical protein